MAVHKSQRQQIRFHSPDGVIEARDLTADALIGIARLLDSAASNAHTGIRIPSTIYEVLDRVLARNADDPNQLGSNARLLLHDAKQQAGGPHNDVRDTAGPDSPHLDVNVDEVVEREPSKRQAPTLGKTRTYSQIAERAVGYGDEVPGRDALNILLAALGIGNGTRQVPR